MIVTSCKTIVAYNRHLRCARGSLKISAKAFKDRLFDARLAMSARERRTVSQSELARAVGVTPQAWSAWEAGMEPDYDRLPLIAKVLGTTVAALMEGTGLPLEQGADKPLGAARTPRKRKGVEG